MVGGILLRRLGFESRRTNTSFAFVFLLLLFEIRLFPLCLIISLI